MKILAVKTLCFSVSVEFSVYRASNCDPFFLATRQQSCPKEMFACKSFTDYFEKFLFVGQTADKRNQFLNLPQILVCVILHYISFPRIQRGFLKPGSKHRWSVDLYHHAVDPLTYATVISFMNCTMQIQMMWFKCRILWFCLEFNELNSTSLRRGWFSVACTCSHMNCIKQTWQREPARICIARLNKGQLRWFAHSRRMVDVRSIRNHFPAPHTYSQLSLDEGLSSVKISINVSYDKFVASLENIKLCAVG